VGDRVEIEIEFFQEFFGAEPQTLVRPVFDDVYSDIAAVEKEKLDRVVDGAGEVSFESEQAASAIAFPRLIGRPRRWWVVRSIRARLARRVRALDRTAARRKCSG